MTMVISTVAEPPEFVPVTVYTALSWVLRGVPEMAPVAVFIDRLQEQIEEFTRMLLRTRE